MMRFHLLRIYVTVIGFCVILTMPISALVMIESEYISSDVEEEIQRLVTEGDIPSLQAGIVFQDQLVWAKEYGLQPSLDTVYMIGSVQKRSRQPQCCNSMRKG
ncbi:MAG: hypothetical protein ACE5I5_06845 [Candidatus Heimdallarchaeota archaeon]